MIDLLDKLLGMEDNPTADEMVELPYNNENEVFEKPDHLKSLEVIVALIRVSDRLRGLLRQYEWIDVFIDNGGYGDKWIKQCLCCKSERDDGHADGCKLAEELGGK